MMTADTKSEEYRDLALLQEIEADPDISQARLAEELGVAIGTINWHIKRLVERVLSRSNAPGAGSCAISSRRRALPCAPG